MNRIKIGALFLGVILALGIALSVGFSAVHDPLAEGLERSGAAAMSGNWTAAKTALEQAVSDWEKCRPFVAAAADHEPLEELESYIAQLKCYLRQENAEFAPLSARTAALARAMGEAQAFSWWNLL